MAKQELIPGGYYLNESATRQYFVAGQGFVNEVGTNIFTNAFTESLTASDGQSAAVTFTASTSDGVTSADGIAGGLLLTYALSEAVTAADTQNGSVTFSAGVSESVTAMDGQSAAAEFTDGVSESTTSAFTFTNTPVYRQELIAGGYGLNETATRQYLLPGHGFVNETSPWRFIPGAFNTTTTPVTETLTATATVTAAATFKASTADFVFASDVPPLPLSRISTYGRAVYGRAEYGVNANPVLSTGSSAASSTYGRIVCGRTVYAGGAGASGSPTFTAPYVSVVSNFAFSETLVADYFQTVQALIEVLMEENLTAEETDVVSVGMNFSLEENVTATDSNVMHTVLSALLFQGRVTRVLSDNRTVRVEK